MTMRPVLISIAMHVIAVVLMLVGLPSISRDLPTEVPLIRMEMVEIVPKTNLIEGGEVAKAKQAQEATKTKRVTPATPPPKPASKPKPPEPKPPEPKPVEPVETAAVTLPEPEAEIVPEKPVAKPKLSESKSPALPKQLPTSKPKRPQKKKPAEPKKPTPAPKPKPKPKVDKAKQLQEELARRVNKLATEKSQAKQAGEAALQNLAKLQKQAKDAKEKRKAQQRKEAADKLKKTVDATAGNAVRAKTPQQDAPVGADELTVIMQHITKCWKPPLGAAGNDALIVDIIVALDKDGGVREARIKDRARYKSDRYFKIAAEEAQRATIECSPLPIPADKYEQMKLLELVFNPAFLSR